MSENSIEPITNGVNNISLSPEEPIETNNENKDDEYLEKWGFILEDLYKLGLQFYKGNWLIS